MTDAMVVLTTLPDADAAAGLAKRLVEERLAACANLLPMVRSIYQWNGALHDEREVLVILKTRRQQLDRLQARLLELHPYEVPELLALPVEQGHAAYLAWMADQTG